MTRFLRLCIVVLALALVAGGSALPSPAAAVETSTYTGTVVAQDGTVVDYSGSWWEVQVFDMNGTQIAAGGINRKTGAFTTTPFPTQPVQISTYYWGQRVDIFMRAWLPASPTRSGGAIFTPAPGANTLPVTLSAGGAIFGSVSTESDGPMGKIQLRIHGANANSIHTFYPSVDASEPNFELGPLWPGEYTLVVSSDNYVWQEQTIDFVVTSPGERIPIDVKLKRTMAIEGTIAVEDLAPYDVSMGPYVTLMKSDLSAAVGGGFAKPDRSYRIFPPGPGQYSVCIGENFHTNWKPACVMDGPEPRVFTVTDQVEVFASADISTVQWGGITGDLLGSPQAAARLYKETPEGFVYVKTSEPYAYAFGSIEPGAYVVEYFNSSGMESREYWENKRSFDEADRINVSAGPAINLGSTRLSPRTYDRERLYGSDRFATNVQISREMFPDPSSVPVVYIANGLNYPDALAAGPAATHEHGGLLLVAPDSIPEVVATELERLAPERIVIVGGYPSVSASVESQLSALYPDVTRISGTDRFDTSRRVAKYAWQGESTDHAFLATGLNFPDALSAGPAAGVRDAPVILVNGGAGTLDSATRNALADLDVRQVHIVGSSASVSTGIESSVGALVGADNIVRYAGFNRFATAVLVSVNNFDVADYAFVATGLGFADALAGGPFAAAKGSPMYLTNGLCLADFVMTDIEAVGANKVYVLGSEASQSSTILNLGTCADSVSGSTVDSLIRLPQGVTG